MQRTILVGIGLVMHAFPALASGSDSLSLSDSYRHGPVYELIFDNQPCELNPDGMTIDLWGNSGNYSPEVEFAVYGGAGLARSASKPGGSKTIYYFFKSKEVCERLVSAGLRTGVRNKTEPSIEIRSETAPSKLSWFVADRNFRSCIKGKSPADKIRELQEDGTRAEVKDLKGGAVEVGYTSIDTTIYWTYYP
ncbi:MAG: hypothetical protein ACRER3_23480, partial [Pseudomonas fluorescens]